PHRPSEPDLDADRPRMAHRRGARQPAGRGRLRPGAGMIPGSVERGLFTARHATARGKPARQACAETSRPPVSNHSTLSSAECRATAFVCRPAPCRPFPSEGSSNRARRLCTNQERHASKRCKKTWCTTYIPAAVGPDPPSKPTAPVFCASGAGTHLARVAARTNAQTTGATMKNDVSNKVSPTSRSVDFRVTPQPEVR
ncbi:MAG: hypothetical protein JWQ00_3019, partial [Noviherbaspirillum sp.]|nr:hypothetical protein [Noviherbaspirillum sp.]